MKHRFSENATDRTARNLDSAEVVAVHPSASIDDDVTIGDGTKVWANVQIRRGAHIGVNCIIGRNCYVDVDVHVGDNVKVQDGALLYAGLALEAGVFVGPGVIFTNDRLPRSITPAGDLKTSEDWHLGRTTVRYGAAIGAGAVVVTGVEIGEWSMIGSGTVVTRDVPEHALVVGNPGRVIGFVSAGGRRCDTAGEARAFTSRTDG